MKLFIGNLSWNTTDSDLERAFGQFGEITEAKVVLDRDTDRSRGFGFVNFTDSQAAQKAIEGLDGSDMDGRPIRVNEAQERAPRGGGGRGGYGGGGGGGGGGRDRY